MTPRQPYSRITWLDQLVRSFQDRWETNPQYRAVVCGVVGLVLVFTLCTCTGLLTLESNNILAIVGLGSNTSNSTFNNDTGSQNVQPASSFPTATFGPVYTSATPVGTTLPTSTTPLPGPTPAPTATAGATTPPGGGTNTATFVCSGGGSGITWTFSPCPLVHGQAGTLTISAPAYPNTSTNILVNFGYCPRDDCTIDDPPGQGYQTNGSGVETLSFTVAQDVQVGGPPVTGEINLSNGPTAGINTQGSCS